MLFSRQFTRHISPNALTRSTITVAPRCTPLSSQRYTTNNDVANTTLSKDETSTTAAKPLDEPKPQNKTQAELDKELLIKMKGMDGDGGDAGVEYEDGKPVSMKRSVKNNMFRYI